MKLICVFCGREENEPYDIGDTCFELCGGKFENKEEIKIRLKILKSTKKTLWDKIWKGKLTIKDNIKLRDTWREIQDKEELLSKNYKNQNNPYQHIKQL